MFFDHRLRTIRKPSLWWAAGILVFLLASQQPCPVHAASGDPKQEAKSHFRAGQKHYNLNEFPDALMEFKEAYRLHSDPVFLYNIGQCERQLGHLEDAARFYRNYLREYPKAPNRQEVERRIDEIDETLKAQAADARKRDEASVVPPPQAGPPLPVAPIEGRTDLTTTAPAPSVSESSPIYTRWWFWTAVAAVAVGATVGIILATSGKDASPPATGLGSRGVF
jgi:tetratricopeptide (TPR) repeat protein